MKKPKYFIDRDDLRGGWAVFEKCFLLFAVCVFYSDDYYECEEWIANKK